MAALSTAPKTLATATSKVETESRAPQRVAESNQAALGALGMGGKVLSDLRGVRPQTLTEEVAAMDPMMVGVVLDALPQPALAAVLPGLAWMPAVVDWVLESRPALAAHIPGIAEAAIERFIPVGTELELALAGEVSVKLDSVGFEGGVVAKRVEADRWEYTLKGTTNIKVGADKDKKVGETQARGEAEAKANVGMALGIEGVFQDRATPADLSAMVLGGAVEQAVQERARSSLMAATPEAFNVEFLGEAELGASAEASAWGLGFPGFGGLVADAAAELGADASVGARLEMDSAGKNDMVLSLEAALGFGIEGGVELSQLLQAVADAGPHLKRDIKVRIDLNTMTLTEIVMTEESNQGQLQQRFTSVEEACQALCVGEGEVEADERFRRMKGSDLKFEVREDLPYEEAPEYLEESEWRSRFFAGSVDLQVSQEVRYVGPATTLGGLVAEIPASASEISILRTLVACARTGSGPLFSLAPSVARSVLEIQDPRVVGSFSREVKDAGDLGLAVEGKTSREIDLPYKGGRLL